jgi:imidazolonepropionase
MAMAVRLYGMTPDEALAGATREAARSLETPGGVIAVGSPADLVVWDLPHEHAIVQPWGVRMAHRVLRGGRAIARR